MGILERVDLVPVWTSNELRMLFGARFAEHSKDLLHLRLLETLIRLLYTIEERLLGANKFGENTSNRPHVNSGCIVPSTKKNFDGAVPDGDYGSVIVQTTQGLLVDASQAKVADLHTALFSAFSHDENVGRLEIPMHDPIAVQIVYTIEQLPHDGFGHVGRHPTSSLFVVVHQNREIVLGELEYQVKKALCGREDIQQSDDVLV
mmetsp:Transcript_16103/g.41343  ORF Transcript_16103/g.41343 Transcript_16103/m.41343 type:complete len:204 (-) Transcript_16103:795-1406(-)